MVVGKDAVTLFLTPRHGDTASGVNGRRLHERLTSRVTSSVVNKMGVASADRGRERGNPGWFI